MFASSSPHFLSLRAYVLQIKRDLSLNADFAAIAFQEFQILSPEQVCLISLGTAQTILFKSFFVPFFIVESAFWTYRSGQMNDVVHSGGEILNVTKLDTFRFEGSAIPEPKNGVMYEFLVWSALWVH